MERKPSEKTLKTLQNIVSENPWFAIGQQLLATETKRLGKKYFENYLNKAAIYSISREFLYYRLFDFIQNEDNNVETQTVDAETQNINTESQNADIEKQIVDTEIEAPAEEQKTENLPLFDSPVTDYFTTENINVNETSEDIIDKFLASPQKISAAHKTEQAEIAANSITEPIYDDDFVTETLAKIYAEQGYISKAIAVYEKLSLQDSKKSTYFAALIENLKRRS
jgi:hypothetical protein